MAQIVKRTKKDGSTAYLFRVSVGYSVDGKHITQSQTYTPPAGLTGRKLEKEVCLFCLLILLDLSMVCAVDELAHMFLNRIGVSWLGKRSDKNVFLCF